MAAVPSLSRLSRLSHIKEILQKEPSFRISQVQEAIYSKKIQRYDEISILPQSLRTQLKERLGESTLSIRPARVSTSWQATKVLFELHDKNNIEAVYMKFKNGKTSLCISSQVGCALRCSFCATGAVGFKRQLSADEITDQILYFQQQKMNVDSIAFMGMGEPFQNPKVFDALSVLTDPKMFGFAQRRLSISTVGIIPAMKRLQQDFPNVNLAFSLHSPFPEQRSQLVPTNDIFPLADCMAQLIDHVTNTKRKVFIAYLLLPGINDSHEHAKEINRWFQSVPKTVRHLLHVNLLRYNPTPLAPQQYPPTDKETKQRFEKWLVSGGTNVTTRQSFGVDIDAACGQLYANYKKHQRKGTKKTE